LQDEARGLWSTCTSSRSPEQSFVYLTIW
jgi:hypothetical protein